MMNAYDACAAAEQRAQQAPVAPPLVADNQMPRGGSLVARFSRNYSAGRAWYGHGYDAFLCGISAAATDRDTYERRFIDA